MKRVSQGFSMMEVMLAVAIIGILAALVGPAIVKKLGQVKLNTTKATMASIKSAIMDYQNDVGHFPTKAEKGLQALVHSPRGAVSKKWDGPYLEGQDDVPQDAWGFDFEYNAPPVKNKGKFKYFEIISYGEEGEDGGSEPILIGA